MWVGGGTTPTQRGWPQLATILDTGARSLSSFLGRTCSPPQSSSWTTRSSFLKVPGQLGGRSSEERSLSWSLATRGPTGRPVGRVFTSSSATSAPIRGNRRNGGRASGSSRTQRTTTWTRNSSEKANPGRAAPRPDASRLRTHRHGGRRVELNVPRRYRINFETIDGRDSEYSVVSWLGRDKAVAWAALVHQSQSPCCRGLGL